jgi:hypothetical protein
VPSAVDADVHPPSIFGRQELVNCCEDGRELAADTESGQKPGKNKQKSASFNTRKEHSHKVEHQRDLSYEMLTMKIFLRPMTKAITPKSRLPTMPPIWYADTSDLKVLSDDYATISLR